MILTGKKLLSWIRRRGTVSGVSSSAGEMPEEPGHVRSQYRGTDLSEFS